MLPYKYKYKYLIPIIFQLYRLPKAPLLLYNWAISISTSPLIGLTATLLIAILLYSLLSLKDIKLIYLVVSILDYFRSISIVLIRIFGERLNIFGVSISL